MATTKPVPPRPPTFAERELQREDAERTGEIHARAFSRHPASRRAGILATRLKVMAGRIEDPELPDEKRRGLARAVDRAWAALENVEEVTIRRLFLLEAIEIVAAAGGPADEVRHIFEGRYEGEGKYLRLDELAEVLGVWNTPSGRPRGPALPMGKRRNKWDLAAALCKSSHLGEVSAATLRREWERHPPPAWVASFKRKALARRPGA